MLFRSIQWGRIDDFYTATVQSVEEAVLNALVANETVEGRLGHKSYSLPHDQVIGKLKKFNRI